MNSSPVSRRMLLAAFSAAALLAGCGKKKPLTHAQVLSGATVLALGDSLTAGVGTDLANAYPSVLRDLTQWEVVNGGVSGDTSAQALARLPALLAEHQPALVIVSIGGNDFLRQMSAKTAENNIRQICTAVKEAGAQCVLVAIPQFSLLAASGARLRDHPLYEELASEMKLPLHADGWAQVLSEPSLRSDQVHANAKGYREFTEGLVEFLRSTRILS